jgi:hypothetical protein
MRKEANCPQGYIMSKGTINTPYILKRGVILKFCQYNGERRILGSEMNYELKGIRK